MKRIILPLLLLLVLSLSFGAAAETGVAYGVYHMEGESPDSLIRATVEVADGKLTAVSFDEKLLPVSFGGAEGWAELPADSAAEGALSVNGKLLAPAFLLGGEKWTVAEDCTVTGETHGELIAYITTDEGGEWYFSQESADLMDAQGAVISTVTVGTKESIEHGVHFWMSDLLFPGNIKAIEDFILANGVDYTADQFGKTEEGFWSVADAVSGATLAGTPNYLLLAKDAYDTAVAK